MTVLLRDNGLKSKYLMASLLLAALVGPVEPASAQSPADAAPQFPAAGPSGTPAPPPFAGSRPPDAARGPAGRPNGAGLPPQPRELTPAEIAALQSAMTDRSANSILTPGNVAALRDRLIDAQAAMARPGYSDEPTPVPKPRTLTIAPEVGAAPQELHLALGLVTPITVLDSGGRPWPIAGVAYDPRILAEEGVGCGSPATSQPPGLPRPTTIHLMPCKVSSWGNVSIELEGYPLPIVFMVKSGSRGTRFVDLPVTVKVAGASPSPGAAPAPARVVENANTFTNSIESPTLYAAARNLPPAQAAASGRGDIVADPAATGVTLERRPRRRGERRIAARDAIPSDRVLDLFASGTPPRGAEPATVDDPAIAAWMYQGRLYMRGPITVVNPAYDGVANRPDGVRVWRFNRPTSRVLVVDDKGAERGVSVDF